MKASIANGSVQCEKLPMESSSGENGSIVKKEFLMNEIANDHLIGVLIITDFYLNQNQVEFLRYQYPL